MCPAGQGDAALQEPPEPPKPRNPGTLDLLNIVRDLPATPRNPAGAPAVSSTHRDRPMTKTEELRLRDHKILIVDDDPEVLSAIDQALQAEGALTQTCTDGNSAVRICETEPPELVVLDMMLPRRSGFLVLERIKKTEKPPRVIMVTANEGRRHQQYAEALGVDGYMLKPVRLERLITLAQELLG